MKVKIVLFLFISIFLSCNKDIRTSNEEKIIDNLFTNIFSQESKQINNISVKDSLMNELTIDSLFKIHKSNKLLCFRFDVKSCDLCLEKEIHEIEKLAINKQNKVVLLISSENINHFKVLNDKYKHILTNYLITDFKFQEAIEEKLLPYYFVLESPNMISHIYTPDKNLDITKYYFNTVNL